MATVVLSASVKLQTFPTGTTGGMWRFVLNPVDDVGSSQDVTSPVATFTGVMPGDYTASVQRLDGNGDVLGDAVSVAFTIGVDAVAIDVPDALSVEVTP